MIPKKTAKSTKLAKPSTFNVWYAKHKEEYAAKRREKYKADVAYRLAAKANAAAYRAAKREESPPTPFGHDYNFREAAEEIGITTWALREWRKKSYFPEPTLYKGSFWFTAYQVSLLQKLKTFWDIRGVRISASKKADLEELVSLVYANWSSE
jgi:hypothetical protein